MDADPGGAVGPGAAHDRHRDRGANPPRNQRLTLALALVLALVVGCILAFQTYYIWQLHDQVTRLQVKVCDYQQGAHRLAVALGEAGHPVPPGTLPAPEQCP